MIQITKLNGKQEIINCEHIEIIESNPDTTITMASGRIIIAKEAADEIVSRTVEYKRRINIQ